MSNENQPSALRSLGIGACIGGGIAGLVWLLTGCGSAPHYAPPPPDVPPMPRTNPVVVAVVTARATQALAVPAMTLTVRTQSPVTILATSPIQKRGSLSLAWNASPDASVVGYRLYFGTNSFGAGLGTQSASVGNSTKATLTGLDEGTRYYVVCVAYDAAGVESVNSNEALGVTPIYVGIRQERWIVESFGMLGRTNLMQISTNLTNWRTIHEWFGNGNAVSVLHTNVERASFRVEALP